jgi:hypothetical protein
MYLKGTDNVIYIYFTAISDHVLSLEACANRDFHSQHVRQFEYDSSAIRIYPIHEGKDGMVKKKKKRKRKKTRMPK